MLTKSQALTALLLELKQQMQHLSLWQTQSPSAEALASTQPFCLDTLAFEQWLQFIFIARIEFLIDNGDKLPTQISLCPMAEEAFSQMGDEVADLINGLADIDELLSGQREQTLYVR